ncbi:MAG: SpoIID/LytB domain-containing protein, partial [Candidatus Omnitrophica bacterium]|nr:SpoIID/LytB domain-containing protein [Candidatus Omnitrophota bacterium]
KIFIIFLSFAFFVPTVAAARNNVNKKLNMLRVCVVNDKPSIYLKIKGPYTIETLHTKQIIEKSKRSLGTSKVVPTNSGLEIGDKTFSVYGIRIIPTVGANIYIDKRRFRGVIDIIRTKKTKLLVINHIDVEDYLYGVLYYETPHYWPMEALMVQAIAARTFALYRKEEMKKADYDLTSDVYSQVYGGQRGERWRTKWAVNLTKEKVLTYNRKIFPTYFHSICGGHTEDASNLWTTDLTPLKGRKCPYCKRTRRFSWKAMFSYKQMEQRLNAYGIKCKGVSYILEGKRNKSGRLTTIRIKDSNGVIDIPANKFRLALGPAMIRSTNFTIKITPKGVLFVGKGWGHGVGMCQWGAFGMAQRGYDHDQILYFYYPGTKIEKL